MEENVARRLENKKELVISMQSKEREKLSDGGDGVFFDLFFEPSNIPHRPRLHLKHLSGYNYSRSNLVCIRKPWWNGRIVRLRALPHQQLRLSHLMTYPKLRTLSV